MANIHVFDKTLQKSHLWIEEIQKSLETGDENRAYLALRTVLHSLRNHLQLNEAIHLGAELPMLIRGLYFEGWDPREKPIRDRDKKEFLHYFKTYFSEETEVEIEKIMQAVFKVLDSKISEGEIKDVRDSLPSHIRNIWIH